jgi:hypothetical protein
MDSSRRPADELVEVVRVLLLLQGAILVASTIEALFWGLVFPGAGASVALSGAAAAAVLVARARLRADRLGTRRIVYIVEGVTLVTVVIDSALAFALAAALPPAVALLTRFVLPLCVIALLRRAVRATAPISIANIATVELMS